MKSLELKALKMNDNFPLIISLNGKVEWEFDENMDIVNNHLVNRDDARCTSSTISQIMLYPSSDKAKIVSTLNYFFSVCDESLSPQCMWKTDDCDYMSLFLEYHIEVITKDGNHTYGCGVDLDVALATFNEYVESSSC